MKEPEFAYPVSILWGPGAESENEWNNISVWCFETYGLPGDRYITDLSAEHMTWFFRNETDAVFMKLKYGALAHLYDYR